MNEMKKISSFIILLFLLSTISAQTTLTEAVDFLVKDTEGDITELFPLLDEENKIVVIDFFTTS